MRPYPPELLRSINKSLNEVIIPELSDDWARYVARSMEKIIDHLARRWEHEIAFLALDTAELDEVLRELLPALDGHPELAVARAAVAERLDAGEPLPPILDISALTAQNEAYRHTLQRLIEDLEAAAADAELREQLQPLRDRIRVHLRRELDRDVVLAEPAYMLFGPSR
jgi:hypothetical protein